MKIPGGPATVRGSLPQKPPLKREGVAGDEAKPGDLPDSFLVRDGKTHGVNRGFFLSHRKLSRSGKLRSYGRGTLRGIPFILVTIY